MTDHPKPSRVTVGPAPYFTTGLLPACTDELNRQQRERAQSERRYQARLRQEERGKARP